MQNQLVITPSNSKELTQWRIVGDIRENVKKVERERSQRYKKAYDEGLWKKKINVKVEIEKV